MPMLTNRLMFFFWRLQKKTGFAPFEWVGNFLEDYCRPVYRPEFLERIEESRREIAAGRYDTVTIDELSAYLEQLRAEGGHHQ